MLIYKTTKHSIPPCSVQLWIDMQKIWMDFLRSESSMNTIPFSSTQAIISSQCCNGPGGKHCIVRARQQKVSCQGLLFLTALGTDEDLSTAVHPVNEVERCLITQSTAENTDSTCYTEPGNSTWCLTLENYVADCKKQNYTTIEQLLRDHRQKPCMLHVPQGSTVSQPVKGHF